MMRAHRTPSVHSAEDPLSAALRPPPEETEDQRLIRLQQEAHARLVSDRIDEELRIERERLKKRRGDVKLLLLGQSESGKSTLQKQFQLMYSPGSLESERLSWRIVVYFNILRTVKKIIQTLEQWGEENEGGAGFGSADNNNDTAADANPLRSPTVPSFHSSTPSLHYPSLPHNGRSLHSPSKQELPQRGHYMHPGVSSPKDMVKNEITNLRLRLSPLVIAESQLADRLSGGVTVSGSGKGEVFVRAGWQRTVDGAAMSSMYDRRMNAPGNGSLDGRPDTSRLSLDSGIDELVDDVASMLDASREDIKELWDLPLVKVLMARRRLRLDEWSEFFLNDILRIASTTYVPTTDDILHARIQTMGVAEHVFDVNIHAKTVTWHLYDVGGARGQRHTWVPFFDDANAIIFVAPISAFDQYLEEDPRTNRIDDSLQLFTQICSNPLLKRVHLVLFLNKTDLLKKKLARGMSVQRYITSFGDRPNEFDAVVNYFRAHFLQVHRRNNENKRVLYTHLTSVVDTKTTQSIIGNVRDSIFRGYLQSAALV